MKPVSMSTCKKRLATLWFIGGGFLFFLLILQTIFGHYGDRAREAWGWLLPAIMPTFSLVVSVFVMDILGKGSENKMVDGFFFWFCFGLSSAYLIVVASMILLQPFAPMTPLELLKLSTLFLCPIQGLVTAFIGAFFVKREASTKCM